MQAERSTDKKSRVDRLILLAFTLAALVTRLYGTASFPLFDDEVTSYFRGIEYEYFTQFPCTDLLIILFFKLFGTSEFFLRLPMALFGAFSIPLFFALTRRLYDRFTAVSGSLLLLFSYYHLDHSQLTRYYAAIFFFGVLALYFYLRFFETYDKKTLLWALLSTLGGILFHPTFLAVVLSMAVFSVIVLLAPRFKNLENPRPAAKLLCLCLGLCMLAALVVLFPLIEGWYYRTRSTGGGWGYDCFHLALQTLKYFSIPISLAAVGGVLVMLKREPFRGAYCTTMVVVPAIGLFGSSFFVDMRPDYIFYSYPVFFLASARFLAHIRDKTRDDLLPVSVLVILLVFMMPEFVSNYSGKRSMDARVAVEYLKEHYREGDKILSFLEGFNFYLGPDYKTEDYLGTWYHSGWDQKLRKYERDPHRLWIVYIEARDGVSPSLKRWLSEHARLVLEVPEKRFDYTFKSIRIYLKE
jgi:4-amino-4-deoxy-L-arabinose transferase-like glycosyltransferase